MLGKIKEYVIKNLFLNIPIEIGPSQEDVISERLKDFRQPRASNPGILWGAT